MPESTTSPENSTEPEAHRDEAAASQDATQSQPADAEPAKSADEGKKWKPPPPARLEGAVEALLLTSGDVVKWERLRDLLGLDSLVHVKEAVGRIKKRWETAKLAMELEEVAGGVRAVTRPEFAEYVDRLRRRPASDKLSRSLLETLSIVAYKQPVPRAEVERIRGVQGGDALRALLERRLIKVAGRSDQPGRPLLYGTTQRFLTLFGLRSLKDLPSGGDLKRL